MAPPSVAAVQVENVEFPPTVKAPGSDKSFFLGGAGNRGLPIQGKFVKFTAIGVYLEDDAIPALAAKWKGKTAEELTESVEFFREIVTGGFEKFTRVTMILPLTGQQYAEKVSENCVAIWKALGIYTEAEEKAIDKFVATFKHETFPPGSSILFTQSPKGSLTITFSKDGSIPEAGNVVIENKLLSEAVLESIIGKNGVSPAARKNVAARLYDLFNHSQNGSSLHLSQKGEKGENGLSLYLSQKAEKDENGSSLDLGQKAEKGENGSSLDLGQKDAKGENGSSLDLSHKAEKGENGSSLI